MKSTVNFARNVTFAFALGVALLAVSVPGGAAASALAAPSTATQSGSGAASMYRAAQDAEKRLQKSPSLRAKKSEWIAVARKYRRVVLEHPRSGYCDDALYYEGEIYLEVDRRFKDKNALRRAMDAYLLLANGYPSSKWARKARLTRGKLFFERYSNQTNASIELRKVLAKWPGSSEGAEAKRVLERMRRPERRATSTPTPTPTPTRTSTSASRSQPASAKSSRPVMVTNVRHWTGDEYTRIVVDIEAEVKHEEVRLANPDRLYFDFFGTRVTESLASRVFFIENGFLQRIRVGQNRPGVVRVVLDLESISEYNIFSLPDPYRLVIDVLGTKKTKNPPLVARTEKAPQAVEPPPEPDAKRPVEGERASVATPAAPPTSSETEPPSRPVPNATTTVASDRGTHGPAAPGNAGMASAESASDSDVTGSGSGPNAEDVTTSASADGSSEMESESGPGTNDVAVDLRLPPAPTRDGYSLARQLGLVPQRVIIDAGHGGHDPGTTSRGGIKEKDLVLDIARRVKKLLEQDGFEVMATRERDVFVPLEERTAIANSKSADLFVSIHANAARSSKARGVETYYLNLATTPDAEEVAARENAVSTRRIGELQSLLQKIINNSRIAESRELASHVQNTLAVDLLPSRKDSRNRGVKTAPFYVLLGAQMPSVLVEVAYLSNRQDETLVRDGSYRQKLARAIAGGIRSYHATLVRTTDVAVTSQP